jgi:hypothetical protein
LPAIPAVPSPVKIIFSLTSDALNSSMTHNPNKTHIQNAMLAYEVQRS